MMNEVKRTEEVKKQDKKKEWLKEGRDSEEKIERGSQGEREEKETEETVIEGKMNDKRE